MYICICKEVVMKKNNDKIKGRIAPALLSSLALALTVFVFGPFELYANNIGEFLFGVWDFLGIFICVALGICALLVAALIFLPRRVFDAACAAIAAISLMLYVEGTFLTLGMTSIEGDGIGDGVLPISKIVINILIWIIVIGAGVALSVIFSKKRSDGVRTAIIFAMVVILGMQTVSFVTVAATTEGVFEQGDRSVKSVDMLTYDGIEGVGSENNVIYFVVDRFATQYFETAMDECPEIFEELEGFTYYGDAVSMYPRTYPAITYLLSGVENDFSMPRTDYFKHAWGDSAFLDAMNEAGYSINVYTDSYYAYESTDIGVLPEYISNSSGEAQIVVSDTAGLRFDMCRLSLYRYLPFACRELVGAISSDDFTRHVDILDYDSEAYSTDMKVLYEHLGENPLTTGAEKSFSFIHIQGVHLPNKYDRNFEPATDDNDMDEIEAMIQSFKIINLYIEQLKELGLYEDATIIITGDHSSIGSDTKDPYYAHLTSLMVKPRGEGEGELKISSAPVAQEDLHATVLASEGIDATLGYGRSIFDIAEDEIRERGYYFQRMVSEDDSIEVIKYKITGPAADFKNWTVVERVKLESDLYD